MKLNQILIIINGSLAEHFLEQILGEKLGQYFFTIIIPDAKNEELKIENKNAQYFNFDTTIRARMMGIMGRDFSQGLIYVDEEFLARETYKLLRELRPGLELSLMDFWDLKIEDSALNLIDARGSLAKRMIDFLPGLPLIAQYIGLGAGELMEIKIPAHSIFAYRHLASIQQRRWRIVLIYRDNKINFAKASFILQPGDSILVVGDPAVLRGVFQNILGERGHFPAPFGSNIYCLINMKMDEKILKRLVSSAIFLGEKTQARMIFFDVLYPKLGRLYDELIMLNDEGRARVHFDFFNENFKNFEGLIKDRDVGLFICEEEFFEKYKRRLHSLKIPVLKIGENEMSKIKNSVILSEDEGELERAANVIIDLSKQCDFYIMLYYYNPHLSEDVGGYLAALAKLYGKEVEFFYKNDLNPLLTLRYRDDLLQFLRFDENILASSFSRKTSTNLSAHYQKMNKNYQLFLPVN